jgi:Zn-dependent protease with chaperone function
MIIFTVPLFVSLDFLFYTVISPSLFSMVLTVLFMIFAVFDIMVIFPYTRKMAEINADRYVGVTLGMASEMIEALETLMALNARPREYWSLSSRTHPSIDLRIRKLRNYTG